MTRTRLKKTTKTKTTIRTRITIVESPTMSSAKIPGDLAAAEKDIGRMLQLYGSSESTDSWQSILFAIAKLKIIAHKYMALAELRQTVRASLAREVPGQPRRFSAIVNQRVRDAVKRGATLDECEQVMLEEREKS
jgi:hypothetical protein